MITNKEIQSYLLGFDIDGVHIPAFIEREYKGGWYLDVYFGLLGEGAIEPRTLAVICQQIFEDKEIGCEFLFLRGNLLEDEKITIEKTPENNIEDYILEGVELRFY